MDNKLKEKDFDRIFKEGKKTKGLFFSLYFNNNGLDYNRFAVTVKTTAGNAVLRNRLKRIIRELYRKFNASLQKGIDLVVVIFTDFTSKSFEQISLIFMELLQKSYLVKI